VGNLKTFIGFIGWYDLGFKSRGGHHNIGEGKQAAGREKKLKLMLVASWILFGFVVYKMM